METVAYNKMPGHWVLASMGKRVLRPGGLELSRWLIDELAIDSEDDVIELAPGLGRTAQITLQHQPKTYIGVEKDETAAATARQAVAGPGRRIQLGEAQATGLPDASASVVYGEAFLTMQTQQIKGDILREAARLLRPGGLYGMHELALNTDKDKEVFEVQQDLSKSIRVNAKPLSVGQWKELLDECGFEVLKVKLLPMALLEPGRLLRDEGPLGVGRMALNLLSHPSALTRVMHMRRQFRKHEGLLLAVGLVARKR